MTLQSSGPISLSQIAAEFGGSGSHSLSAEYYRTGPFVPDNASNAAIPSAPSTQIRFSNFYGTRDIIPHTVSITGSPYGSCQTGTPAGGCTAQTDWVIANVNNGVGPFTWSWSYVSGSTFTRTSDTNGSIKFSKSAAAPSTDGACNTFWGYQRCTVTDTGNGGYQAYADVYVETTHCFSYL